MRWLGLFRTNIINPKIPKIKFNFGWWAKNTMEGVVIVSELWNRHDRLKQWPNSATKVRHKQVENTIGMTGKGWMSVWNDSAAVLCSPPNR